jgi:hypothetical protein
MSGSAEGTVLGFRKKAPDMVRDTHQLLCIDSLKNSATDYWMTVPGAVKAQDVSWRPGAARMVRANTGNNCAAMTMKQSGQRGRA